jgi:hypothetical protein
VPGVLVRLRVVYLAHPANLVGHRVVKLPRELQAGWYVRGISKAVEGEPIHHIEIEVDSIERPEFVIYPTLHAGLSLDAVKNHYGEGWEWSLERWPEPEESRV